MKHGLNNNNENNYIVYEGSVGWKQQRNTDINKDGFVGLDSNKE